MKFLTKTIFIPSFSHLDLIRIYVLLFGIYFKKLSQNDIFFSQFSPFIIIFFSLILKKKKNLYNGGNGKYITVLRIQTILHRIRFKKFRLWILLESDRISKSFRTFFLQFLILFKVNTRFYSKIIYKNRILPYYTFFLTKKRSSFRKFRYDLVICFALKGSGSGFFFRIRVAEKSQILWIQIPNTGIYHCNLCRVGLCLRCQC